MNSSLNSGRTFRVENFSARSKPREAEPDIVTAEVDAKIRESLRGLRFGSVNVVVQDGVVIQIDKLEKTRLREDRNTR